MLKKIMAVFSFFFISYTVFAETCPTPTEIKENHLREWQAFDINDGEPLSAERFLEFQHAVTMVKTFSLAEWMKDAPEGEAHCYYGNASDGYFGVFLAKANFIPDNQLGNWEEKGHDDMQCKPSQVYPQCFFKSSR